MSDGYEAAAQMANLWMEMATKMATSGMAFAPGTAPTDAARSVRDASLTAMAQSADKFMRTPQFLEMMKQSLDASIGFKRQLNQLLTDAHHNAQGVAKQDVDGVARAVRRLETRVLGRIEELCDRLDAVSKRLDAIENGKSNPGGNGHAKAGAAEVVRPPVQHQPVAE